MENFKFREENLSLYFKSRGIFRKKCICCGNDNFTIWTEIFNSKVKTLKCNNCNYLWMYPICKENSLKKYYDDYIGKRRLKNIKKMKQRNIQYDLDVNFIKKSIKSGKFLDIGCNGGFFLNKLSSKFQKYGIDIDKKAIQYGKKKFSFKKNLKSGSFLKANYKRSYFDGILLRGTIEHLISPEVFLKKISYILKPNGRLFIIATPNSSSISAKLFKEHWTLYHPIQHLSHFNTNNISLLARKYNLKLIRKEFPYLGTPYENLIFDTFNLVGCFFKIIFSNSSDILNSPPYFKNMMSLELEKN